MQNINTVGRTILKNGMKPKGRNFLSMTFNQQKIKNTGIDIL